MLQSLRQIQVLNKIFNVRGNEWSKIFSSWFVRFLYRVGFVIGWTVIVAMFVGKYGITALPYLFALIAVFTIIGTFLYSTFLDKFSPEKLLILTIFLNIVMLFFATQIYHTNEVLFYALLIVSVSVFTMQFKIILDGYIEDLFTPLQSERTFPIIEAADTVGGIVAGLAVMSLSNSIETYKFVFLWMVALALIVPALVWNGHTEEVALVNGLHHNSRESIGLFTKIKKAFSHAGPISYVKGMFLIVFLEWVLYNLLEFQYTKAIYQDVSNVIFDAGSGFQHAFVHDLGTLFILFSTSALLIQLFVGGRLINSLGVMGSMLLHPIVTLLSLFGLTASFNYYTAVLAKNNFTITSIIHLNAYHSTYYALRSDLREHIRELFEGIVRPIGAICGTLTLILLQRFFVGEYLILYVNFSLIIVAAGAFIVTYLQQQKYTNLAINDLLHSKDKKVRFNAIDILGQKGHKSSVPILMKILGSKKEPVSIRVRVLKALSELEASESINSIIKCFNSKWSAIRSAALDTLECFRVFQKPKGLFQKYILISELKRLYRKEKSEEIVLKIIHLMSFLSSVSTVEFLVDVLEHGDGRHKAEAIYALGKFNDREIFNFLSVYLNSKNFKEQINAAVALYNVKDYRDEAYHLIFSFLYSRKMEKIECGLFAIGELGLKKRKEVCFHYLNSKNNDLRIHSAISLIKMGYQDGIPVIVNLLLNGSEDVKFKIRYLLKNVDVRISKNIDKIVKQAEEIKY